MVRFRFSKDLGFVAGSSGYIRSEKVLGQAGLNSGLLYFRVHRICRKLPCFGSLLLQHGHFVFERTCCCHCSSLASRSPNTKNWAALFKLLYYGYVLKSRVALLH